jgi:hypothetical protein
MEGGAPGSTSVQGNDGGSLWSSLRHTARQRLGLTERDDLVIQIENRVRQFSGPFKCALHGLFQPPNYAEGA